MTGIWTRRGAFGAFTALVASGFAVTSSLAQDMPDLKRLEIIIPYSAGGGTDRFSRALSEHLEARMDATVTVRNVPGDAAMLGLSRLARAAGDDGMIAFHNPPNTVLAQLARGAEAPVDLRKLTPLAGYAQTYSVLAVSAETPYQTYEELKAAYEAGEIRLFGGTDRGGSAELGATLVKDDWGLPFEEYVAYDGSGDLNAALARAEVPAGLVSYDSGLSGMASGIVRPLVILGATERLDGMPDTPTAVELGLRSLAEVAAPIRIIVGPPDMDPGLRDYMVGLWKDVLTDPEIVAEFAANNVELLYIPPEEVGARIDGAFESLEDLPALKAMMSGN